MDQERKPMRTGSLILAASLLFGAMAVSSVSQQLVSKQTVTVAGLSATISVEDYSNLVPARLFIVADWKSVGNTKYPIGCLSVYHDLRYELRDSAGRLIPINQDAVQYPVYDGPAVLNHMSTIHPLTCAQRPPYPGKAALQALYPYLPGGDYTLQITFAPRGLSQEAKLSPVRLTVTGK
jgi:hypothetical protein